MGNQIFNDSIVVNGSATVNGSTSVRGRIGLGQFLLDGGTDPNHALTYSAQNLGTWVASTAVTVNQIWVPTALNGYSYRCTTAGTTGSTQPTWPTTPNSVVVDGTAVWTIEGRCFAGLSLDGPALYGYSAGALGTTNGGDKWALRWDSGSNVYTNASATVGGNLSVTGSLTANSSATISSAAAEVDLFLNYSNALAHRIYLSNSGSTGNFGINWTDASGNYAGSAITISNTNGNVSIPGALTVTNTVFSNGTAAGYYFNDRSTALANLIYATGGVTYLYNGTYGNYFSVTDIGNVSASGSITANSYLLAQGSSTNSIFLQLNNSIASGRNWTIGSSGGAIGPVGDLVIYDSTAGANRLQIDATGLVTISGSLSSPTVSGTALLQFPSASGTGGFYLGTGDGASYTTYDTRMQVWWGLGFSDYTGTVRTFLDTRTGNFSTQGTVSSSGAGGFSCISYVANTRNPIWYIGNANTYGISYFQGTAGYAGVDSIGFHFGTATALGSPLNVNSTGIAVIGVGLFGQNTNGTAHIDAYSGRAYFGCNSATNGVQIDGNGYVYVNYINSTANVETAVPSHVAMQTGDNYMRWQTPAQFKINMKLCTDGTLIENRFLYTVFQNTSLRSGIFSNSGDGLYNAAGTAVTLPGWWHVISNYHDTNGFGSQIATELSGYGTNGMWIRSSSGATWKEWSQVALLDRTCTFNAAGSSSNPTAMAVVTSGSFGGGYGLLDGSYGINLYSASGTLNFGFGSNTSVASKVTMDSTGTIVAIGVVSGARLYAGYDSGVGGSVSCSNWFRSIGGNGWYDSTNGGGIYMTDTTYVRAYNGKSMAAADFVITSDRNAKHNIRPFEFKGRLTPRSFTLNEKNKPSFGFIAQEVRELYPEAVSNEKNEKYLSLSYNLLTAVLAHQVNTLEDELLSVKEDMSIMKHNISTLQSDMHQIRESFNLLR